MLIRRLKNVCMSAELTLPKVCVSGQREQRREWDGREKLVVVGEGVVGRGRNKRENIKCKGWTRGKTTVWK